MTEQFERRTAIFEPQRADDLKPDGEQWIGRTLEWEACWIIEDGPYEGQWAWAPVLGDDDERPPFAWVPACDLRTTGQVSDCCGAATFTHTGDEGTSHYVCGACDEPCDRTSRAEWDRQTDAYVEALTTSDRDERHQTIERQGAMILHLHMELDRLREQVVALTKSQEVMLERWRVTHEDRTTFKQALRECARLSGADLSGGFPTHPPIHEYAVQQVGQLREDYDEACRQP